jgi:hypothetical protein
MIGRHPVERELSEDWWRRLEGQPNPEDAEHWLDVYNQLLRHFRPLVQGHGDEQLHQRLLDIEKRRQYWSIVKAMGKPPAAGVAGSVELEPVSTPVDVDQPTRRA